jgi:response regulator RpfG family c-di-GMP phosphodiesterase
MFLEESEGRGRILIVDDQAGIRELLYDMLEADYDCVQASTGEEALEVLRGGDFDLILSDITMPGMSGLELIPRALAESPSSVIIMISGSQTIESAIEAMRVGAFDYVTKPFDLDHVASAVSRALGHQHLREQKRRYETRLEELVEQRTEELNRALDTVEGAYRSTLNALTAALDARDRETSGHARRVVTFSLRLGRELGLDREELCALEFGALLHDIGKIGVPDAILRKPSRLSAEEWERMRQHPRYGERILQGIEFLRGASRVVAQHHERWDGTGYPAGLRGREIDLNARIFAVADAFDAITSNRVYRAAKPYEVAAGELDGWAGKQFDPEVVAAFHRIEKEDWDVLRRECALQEAGRESRQAHAAFAAAPHTPARTHRILRELAAA